MKVKSLSRSRLLATPWTVAYQAPLSMDISGKSTGVGCHCHCSSDNRYYLKFQRLKKMERMYSYYTKFLSLKKLQTQLLLWVKFIFMHFAYNICVVYVQEEKFL